MVMENVQTRLLKNLSRKCPKSTLSYQGEITRLKLYQVYVGAPLTTLLYVPAHSGNPLNYCIDLMH